MPISVVPLIFDITTQFHKGLNSIIGGMWRPEEVGIIFNINVRFMMEPGLVTISNLFTPMYERLAILG